MRAICCLICVGLNRMLIFNGRCGNDKNNGAMTFRNQSIIGYSIVSFQSLQYVKNICVLELDTLFSDGHSLISTNLSFGNDFKVKNRVPSNTKTRKPRLPEEKRLNVVENLNCIKMQCLLTDIIQARQVSDSVSKEEVNTFCSQFSEIFNESTELNSCSNKNNTSTTTKNVQKAMVWVPVWAVTQRISPRKES